MFSAGKEAQVNQCYQITRAAELESLAVFRSFIETACQKDPRIEAETIYDLKLAVDEACTNIITHGYTNMDPGSIILSLEILPDQAIIVITDFGHPFEPADAPMPDVEAGLEDRPMGGFGLYFIYQTMDEVGYQETEDGNHLTLVKKLIRTQKASVEEV